MDADEFWLQLSARVSLEFRHANNHSLGGYWIDDFYPGAPSLEDGVPVIHGGMELVKDTTTWREGSFTLKLPAHLAGAASWDWALLLPPVEETNWLALDEKKAHLAVDRTGVPPATRSAGEG